MYKFLRYFFIFYTLANFFCSTTINDSQLIELEKSYRLSSNINESKCFFFKQNELFPLSQYDIKISYLGSVLTINF